MGVVSVRSAFQQGMCLEGRQSTLEFSAACDLPFHRDLIIAPSWKKNGGDVSKYDRLCRYEEL
jgi:hypothetical protein